MSSLIIEILLKVINALLEGKKKPVKKDQIELVKKLNEAESEQERKDFIKQLSDSAHS